MTSWYSKCATAQRAVKPWIVRFFVLAMIVSILLETIPSFLTVFNPVKKPVNRILQHLGLAQGDWPLFAPNPVLNNGTVEADILDDKQQHFRWRSPDWSTQSVSEKFFMFRQMNYFQRLPRNHLACQDFADYLLQAIPSKETVTPALQFAPIPTDDSQSVTLPLRQVNLYHARLQMELLDDEVLPSYADTIWSCQINFLVQRNAKAVSK